MSKKIALFPGQGSQAIGMANAILESWDGAQAILDKANEVLGFDLGKIMAEGPEDALKATQNTQPALFVSSMMAWEYLKSQGVEVDFVAGHSLGEYSAICAAGGLSFEDGLKLVRVRGELMAQAGEKAPGAMAAVLGMPDDELDAYLVANKGESKVVAANYNCPGQIVISGEKEGVEKIAEGLKEAGKKVVILPVSGAFHSPLMEFAKEGLATAIQNTTFNTLSVPVIANVNAKATTNPEEIKELLVQQLTGSVQWTASINTALEAGVEKALEVGSGKVLMGLCRKISRAIKVSPISAPAEFEKIKETF
jgi:[acyl-carrier-protein] S-malonyltransferase